MNAPSGSDDQGGVLVCPTSHLDWDWLDTFVEYFEIGPPGDPTIWHGAVKGILSGVCQLLSDEPGFCFSLAEVAYLQAFLAASPDSLPALASAGPDRFVLMGGGITSPDNLVCHGEVFIRNYLLGRRWLRSVGLGAHVAPVAWLPDDFGHDPQLPVVLAAMGLQWLGLSRVPGSPQPFPNQPLEYQIPSVAAQLENEGLVFPWIASDGSQVVAHYMPATYGAPWDGSDYGGLQKLVEKHGWPVVNGQRILFAPAGGDFAVSLWGGGLAPDWLEFADAYNQRKSGTDPAARLGTFTEFMTLTAGSAGPARSPLLAQNYWTGIFASRPKLKTLHYQAARLALAAEAAATLLRLASTYSTAALDDLDAAIDQAWQALVPSSHHDYVTGTSPDRVYWGEQLPLLELAVRLAERCLTQAVGLIAAGVTVGSGPSQGTPVVVFNPVGFARGGVVQLPAGAVPGGVAKVTAGSAEGQVQRLADGGLLFLVPDQAPVDSFGYTTIALQAGAEPASALPSEPQDIVTLDNGLVTVTIDPAHGWAITSFEVGNTQLLAPEGLGNSIRLYQDDGNIYQFGNEPLTPGTTKTFADSLTAMVGGPGEWVEAGPVRWHFRAIITGDYPQDGQPFAYTLDYLLHAGETVLRMRLTGAAPAQTSVVTAFDLAPAPAGAPPDYGLIYGTANHYDDHEPTPYWPGPTFRATHDFVQTTGTSGPGLAIYHQGVPAWSIYDGQLLGALLRNTPGILGYQRGAAGTDPGVHTQEYALGPADSSPVATGDALRTALIVTNPLVAAVADVNQPANSELSLPQQACLAKITSTGGTGTPAGILRAARTQAGGSAAPVPGYYAERMSFILRAYLPDPASVPDGVTITLPDLPNPGIAGYDLDLEAEVVSALEEPLDPAPPVSVTPGTASDTTISYTVGFRPDRALTTIQLTATRWPTQGDNGQ